MTQPARIYFYLAGERVCAHCERPLTGLRADAKAHPACAREWRRRNGSPAENGESDPTDLSGVDSSRRAAKARQTYRRVAKHVYITTVPFGCPDCNCDEFEVRLAERVVVGRDAAGQEIVVGPRKMLRCQRCGWYGTSKQARDAA